MKSYVITTAVVRYKDKYLIGKRAISKKFASNKWEFISGFVDTSESVEEIILRELYEETKLKGKIVKSADPYINQDEEAKWIIIPYLVEVNTSNFVVNKKDHSELKLLSTNELNNYEELAGDIEQLKIRGLLI